MGVLDDLDPGRDDEAVCDEIADSLDRALNGVVGIHDCHDDRPIMRPREARLGMEMARRTKS